MVEINGIRNEQFEVIEVQDNVTRPNLKAHLLKQGFDGKIYNLRRILTGKARKQYEVLCYRGMNGVFVSMV